MKATPSMSLVVVVVVVMVAMVSAAPRDQSCRSNRMMAKKIWLELGKNLTLSVCSASDTTQCLPKLKDCSNFLKDKDHHSSEEDQSSEEDDQSSEEDDDSSHSMDDDTLLAHVTEKMEEAKKLMEFCVAEKNIQGVNMDAFPQPPKTMEELRSTCMNIQTMMIELNVNMEDLLPITSCMLSQEGKLEPFTECVNSQ